VRAQLAMLVAVVTLGALLIPPGHLIEPAVPLLHASAEEVELSGDAVIVVLADGVDPLQAAQEMGVEPTHVYQDVFLGFAANVPAAALNDAIASGTVTGVTEDGRVQAEDQIVGNGVLRVGMPRDPGSPYLGVASPIDADIAILDTGVAPVSDLNVRGGESCVGKDHKKDKKHKHNGGKGKGKGSKGPGAKGGKGHAADAQQQEVAKKKGGGHGKDHKNKKGNNDKAKAWEDDNGHGTHIAGIAAAINNNQGIVGVAQGARIWSVKVLDQNGSGSFGDVICGLNWVVKNSGTIDVVNLSFSGAGRDGPCENSALHQAICNVVYSGVPVVVAAGNQGTDASARVPASYDQVITVSGMADSDGQPGQLGPSTCSGYPDDTFLPFSNFGADVDIAAPGDCILSLGKDGKLREQSGTSSASPHVAGAIAFYIASFTASNGFRPSPDQVRTWLLTQGSQPQNSPFGFSGDPDGVPEPVLWLQGVFGG